MRNLIITLFTFSFGCGISQNTAKDFFTSTNMVWYGLNFSEAKMVGQFDQAVGANVSGASDIKNKWIPSWNALVISEPHNFKLAEAFRKSDIYMDLGPTDKLNQAIDPEKFMSNSSFSFADPKKTISSVVSQMETGEKKDGFGVVFIVESFNKIQKTASVYVTVFDIGTKSIFIANRISCVPKGIGLRNFWGGAIKEMINQINSTYYNNWKLKANQAIK